MASNELEATLVMSAKSVSWSLFMFWERLIANKSKKPKHLNSCILVVCLSLLFMFHMFTSTLSRPPAAMYCPSVSIILTFQFPLINVIKQQNRWKKCLSILRLYSKVFPRALSFFNYGNYKQKGSQPMCKTSSTTFMSRKIWTFDLARHEKKKKKKKENQRDMHNKMMRK